MSIGLEPPLTTDQSAGKAQDWTAERLRQCGIQSSTMAQYLADEINASITDEREKHMPDKCRVCGMPELRCNHHRSQANRPTYEQLRAQLAAEREKHCRDCCCARSWEALGITENTGMSIPEHIHQLREQLSAERENTALATQMVQIESKRANEAEQQCTAEREKAKLEKEVSLAWTKQMAKKHQQLRDRQQTLVDALKLLGDDGPLVDYRAIARTALSKDGK